MATTHSLKQLDHPAVINATSIETWPGLEAATQSWKAGALLVASSGKLAEASDAPTTGLLGIALKDATGTTNTAHDFIPITDDLTVEVTLEDATDGDHVLAQTNLFTKYSMTQDASTGIWYADEHETSSTCVYVVSLVSPVGDTRGRVRVRFEVSAMAWD